MPGVVGRGVGVEHLFHARHELAVRRGRDHPVLNLAARYAIFLSVRRTVS